MRAVVIHKFGGRGEMNFEEIVTPEAGSGEVRIRVRAAGVNPVDWKIREGWLQSLFPHQFPLVLGWDAAGVIEQVGEGVKNFRIGDEVFVYARKPTVQWGTYAEYLVVPEEFVAQKPRNFTFEEAAAVPLAGLTAYQALIEAGKLRSGQSVLIHAAAGGVGCFAVQLAKRAGARVAGTALRRNHEFLRRLGVDTPIDYSVGDWRDEVRSFAPKGVDIVLECMGGPTLVRSAEVLTPGGRLVSIKRSPPEEAQLNPAVDYRHVFVRPEAQQLNKLRELAERGELRVFLSGVAPLEEVRRVHEELEAGHVRGKLVLRVP